MNYDLYMAHRYCVPDAGVWLTNFVLEVLIGLMYIVFMYACHRINKTLKESSNLSRLRVFYWLIWVFTFCGGAKFLHAANVFIGAAYAFLPINNTFLVIAMVMLIRSAWQARYIFTEQLRAVTKTQIETVMAGGDAQPSSGSYNIVPESKKVLNDLALIIRRYEYMRLAIEQSPFKIAIVDPNMDYIALSEKWIAYFGRHKSQVGDNHYVVFPEIPESRQDWMEDHRQVLEEGQTLWASTEEFESNKFGWHISPLISTQREVLRHEGNIAGMYMLVFDFDDLFTLNSNLNGR